MAAGRVDVWTSVRARLPKHHVDRECGGLERLPEEMIEARNLPSALAVLRTPESRPCRMCALEPLVVGAAQGRWLWQGRQVAVTLSGQARPGEPGPRRYDYDVVTESGAQRLGRLADVVGLEVTDSVAGPVAYGTTTVRWAKVLSDNLRCYEVPGATEDPVHVQAFWSLACNAPFEVHDVLDVTRAWDLSATMVS